MALDELAPYEAILGPLGFSIEGSCQTEAPVEHRQWN